MTIWVSIDDAQGRLEELADRAAAGEAIILSREGVAVAVLNPPKPSEAEPASRTTGQATRPRQMGLYAHLGPLKDPDLFLRPDPELEELAESRDEDHFYRIEAKPGHP